MRDSSPRLGSVRLRAALALGVIGLLSVGGTFAFWTDSVTIDGGTFTSGTLDLQANGSDNPVTATLAMAAMVPGSSAAEVITIKNAGTAPLKYAVTGGLGGADSASYDSTNALDLTLVRNGTRSGSGNSATCTGGSTLLSSTSLTDSTGTSLLPTRGPLAAGETESLCVQVTLASDAPSSLQGKATTLTLTATGTSDVG